MKRVLTATLLMGSASFATALIGLVNRKLLANYVGVTGIGVLDQWVDLNVLMIGLASLGLGDGLIKYVSAFESSGQSERLRDFLSSVLRVMGGLALALAGVLALFSADIARLVFGSAAYAGLVGLLALTLPCAVGAAALRGVVNGYRQVRYLALMSILPAFSILVFVWPLVSTLHLLGAVINVVISTVLTLAVAGWFFVKSAGRPFAGAVLRQGRFQPGLLRLVAGFGAASLIGGFAGSQTLIWVRGFLGVDSPAAGLFSVINGLSEQALNLALVALGSYSYAQISAMQDRSTIAREVNTTLRTVVLVGVPLLFGISVGRNVLVPLLFSDKFMGATPLIPLQTLGDLLKIVFWALALPQLPMGRTRAWLTYWLIWCGTFVGLSYVLIGRYGLAGVVYAHIAAHALVVALLYLDGWRVLDLRLAPGTAKLLGSAALLLGSVVLLPGDWTYYPLFAVLGVAWAALNVTAGERGAALRAVRARLPRPAG